MRYHILKWIHIRPENLLLPNDRLLVRSVVNILVALICSLVVLSIEAAILQGAKVLVNADTNPGQLDAATSAVTYAYIAVSIALIAFGITLMVRAQGEHGARTVTLAAAGGGVLLILLGSGNVPQAPTQFTLPAAIQQVNATAKLLATTDTLVYSSGNKPLGIHVEYAVEYASTTGSLSSRNLPCRRAKSFVTVTPVLISALEWFTDPSGTLPRVIRPDQYGDVVQLASM